MSRPTSQHRLSVGSPAASLPARHSYNRPYSHTVSLGSNNADHRVSRRKSSTFAPNASAAAIGAAVERGVADGSIAVNRRSSMSRTALGALNDGSHPPIPSSLHQHASVPEAVSSGSAVDDGPSLSSFQADEKSKLKARRASEGTRLTKKEKAATGDLKCEHCGKGYKHGSCLTKHLWEHTPQWQYTSKLLISKHQQVQLLEAASVLVGMNTDGSAIVDSDNSSSPATSGSSDTREEEPSSAETTPPPGSDSAYRDSKRYSNSSSAYSRSYQSVFSSESVPKDNGFSHHRQWSSSSNRPTTAGTSIAESYPGQDPEDISAAIGLLSCSYGTPKTGPATLSSEIPPVPPLPSKYQSAYASKPTAFHAYRDQDDMDLDDESSDDEPVRRHEDMDDGLFGKMDA